MIPAELHERVRRIANRAVVDEQTAFDAVLGRAGVRGTLVTLNGADLAAVLEVVCAWDSDDDDANDPAREELEAWADNYRRSHR